LEQVRDPDDEPTFEGSIDCEFEKDDKITLQQLKVMILEEINTMKKLNKEQPIDIPKELERCHQIGQVLQSQKGSKEEKKKQ
jgi:mitogen-activated protein kinase 1/3